MEFLSCKCVFLLHSSQGTWNEQTDWLTWRRLTLKVDFRKVYYLDVDPKIIKINMYVLGSGGIQRILNSSVYLRFPGALQTLHIM